ncbi:aspartate/glutamate racemase family protein [Thiofilum flexile]|uniref:aspartate/glutamate racemase family protein n=1 Tax=Thiofilum flexile TaxID=125627 RepID=UPI00037138C9|nr:aspartate/glutamate racemase family protein [Thiofilum flexile]
MRIAVINPNSTASMTAKIGRVAQAAARSDTEILALNPPDSPASIEGYYDEAMSLAPLLRTLQQQQDTGKVDAFVIACFDDTGLDAARCLTTAPVIGIGEAAYHMASLVANKFSVVTTLPRSIPALEHNLTRYGLISRCARVRAASVPVLELERAGSDAGLRIRAEIEAALREDQAEAIVLGCAGMADLADQLSAEYGVPVLDGVRCAVALAEAMVSIRLQTGKTGGYALPVLDKGEV